MKRTRITMAWAVVNDAGSICYDEEGRACIFTDRQRAEDCAALMNPEGAVRIRRLTSKAGKGKKR